MRWLAVIGLVACTATQGSSPPAHPPTPPTTSVLARVEAAHDLDGVVVGASDARATLVITFASWCEHCKDELAIIDSLRAQHPRLRVLGVSWQAHEEYAQRGSPDALRAYVAASAPWLRVIPADGELFTALGQPPLVPTMFVFDRSGALKAKYDRRRRRMPDAAELGAVLARLGS